MKRELPLHPLTREPIAGTLDPAAICPSCTRCCRYVSIGINAPSTLTAVSNILWYLYHKNVSVYEDHEGEWAVVFGTDCENLKPDGLCGVYENRPLICRDYDIDGCEGTSPVAPERISFATAPPFVAWLKKKKPKLYEKCKARKIIPKFAAVS